MKKLFPILTLILALFALTGCEEEASKTTHATNINSTEKAVKESPKKGIDRTHNLTVQGQTLTLTSSYQVDERNLIATSLQHHLSLTKASSSKLTLTRASKSVSPIFILTLPYPLSIPVITAYAKTA